tara:strand:- start:571 stop:1083 length:513 start_codon:yes stop_codon:yes gene_type:complete
MVDINTQTNTLLSSTKIALDDYYKNNNPGNVKYFDEGGIEGEDYYTSSKGIKYKKFNTKAEGLSAIAETIRNISEKLNTNSLEKIMKEYAKDDKSGKRFSNYESRLTKTFNIPKEINLEDDTQVKNLIMGITDVENPTLDKPELNHNLYYFETDYDDAVNLFKDPVMAVE